MHPLLKRQLAKLGLGEDQTPDAARWYRLLERISRSYEQSDRDRYLLEHSMQVSSEEMRKLYEDLRASAEDRLHVEKERAQKILQSIGDAVISTDARGRIDFMNASAERLTGWRLPECQGESIRKVFRTVSNNTRKKYRDPYLAALHDCTVTDIGSDTLLVTRDLSEIPIMGSVAPILDKDSKPVGTVLVFSDVTRERRLREQLEYQASHDILTGLHNRPSFEQALASLVADSHRSDARHVLLYMDLDQFKIINDTCGHSAGDQMLKRVADLMQAHTRSSDTLARLGGDEFGLLLYNCPMVTGRNIAEEILNTVRQHRFHWDGHTFEVGISIGLVEISGDSMDAGEAMSNADLACYIAKDNGRNRVHAFERSDAGLADRKQEMSWATSITRGLDEDRFVLMRQAIVPIDGSHDDGQHYEILVRLRDTDGRLIPPGAFIPAAERFGLMPALDRWVIRKTLQTLAGNRLLRDATHMCSINLSGLSLGDSGLLDYILEQIREWGVSPTMLCFEITETAVISDLSNTRRLIDNLQFHGCRFALDDFGSGLSSFSYLKELPVDFLKIDGNFVRNICNDTIDASIVSSIHQVGRVMDIKTIAEFVEDTATLERLKAIGVDYAQGYGIQAPVAMTSTDFPATTSLEHAGSRAAG